MEIVVKDQDVLMELAQSFASLSSLLINQPNSEYVKQLIDHYADAEFLGEDELRNYLNGSDLEELTVELAKEWTLLFRGLSPTYGPKPPYVGVHCSDDGVGIDTLLELTEIYKGYGLVADLSNKDRLDYLAYSFDFIGYLLKKVASESGDIKQKYIDELDRYLNKYILPWLEQFVSSANKHAKTPFYRATLSEVLSCVNLAKEAVSS